jgi:glyoxylase-like metal-dependent hydrolase (beta-lactamase superfamily II)
LERTEKVLISGDTLFAGAIGRTDHPGGDYDLLMKSIFEKLICLDGDVTVIPGHGPDSSIANERMTNPFLLPFNQPLED